MLGPLLGVITTIPYRFSLALGPTILRPLSNPTHQLGSSLDESYILSLVSSQLIFDVTPATSSQCWVVWTGSPAAWNQDINA